MSYRELSQYLDSFKRERSVCPLCEAGSHDHPLNTEHIFKCGCPCHIQKREQS